MKPIITLALCALTGLAAQAQLANTNVRTTPMKRQTTLSQLRATSHMAIKKAAPHKAEGEPITDAPAGTLIDNMYATSKGYGLGLGDTYVQNVDGGLGGVVEAEDGYIYVKAPISQAYVWLLGTPWIRCEKAAGDTIVMLTPQLYAIDAGDPYYINRMVFDKENNTFVTDSTQTGIKFTWKNRVLTQVDSCLVGFCDASGEWFYMGDEDIVYREQTDVVATIPPYYEKNVVKMEYTADAAHLDSTAFRMLNAYILADTDDEPTGNTIYFDHLEDGLPDGAICATANLNDNSMTIDSKQYLGPDPNYNAHIYALTGRAKIEGTDKKYFNYDLTDHITLHMDGEESDTIAAAYPASIVINCGKDSLYIVSDFVAPRLISQDDVAMTPADPIFTRDGVKEYPQSYKLNFTIPTIDIEGNYLNINDLYYCLYYNGEPYTFTTELYPGLTKDMSEIPFSFIDNNYDICEIDGKITIYFRDKNWDTLGIESIYRGGGEDRRSNIVTVTKEQSGLSDVSTPADIKSIDYFDLTGRKVTHPSGGIYLEQTSYTDGTRTTAKKVRP